MSQMNPDPSQPPAPTMQAAPPPPGYWVPPPPPPPPSPRGEPNLWRWIVVSFLVAIIAAGGSGLGVGWGLAKALRTPTVVQSPIAIASPTQAPSGALDANRIAAQVNPAIVDINTVVGTGQAAGTGMILTSDGQVLTNDHVVDGSSSIRVSIAGRSGTFPAHVIGVVSTASDVALIQIEGVSGLPTVTLASSSTLKVGDPVVAIGNALGLGGTPKATQGTVTALNQTITASEGNGRSEQLTGMIQSDAPISPGDSGGPIVNSAAQVVGMITAGDVQGFGAQTSTVNYAIPADTALSFVNVIRSGQPNADIVYGQVGFMGVSVRDLTQSAGSQLGVSSGALVVNVQSGGPADAAGITPNSVIVQVGDASITSSNTLGTAIRTHKPGEKVSVKWVDTRGTHTSTVTLAGVNP